MRLAHPFGNLSARKLLAFVAGLLAATFSFAALFSTPVLAEPEATWSDGEITYKDNTYSRSDNGKANDPRGVPEGSMVFAYVDPSVWPQKAHYIFFPSDTDANSATQAHYVTTDFSPPNTHENVSDVSTITIQAYETQNETTTSCNQEGIGWIICPLTNWLASGMDHLYSLISGFLEVRPAQTTTENALYRAWSFMRNTANVLFVIGFLVIIYSQITNFGLSNYSIKKMLPRLVIAAILVNISYWVCAAAIDVSNILGYSIQDVFIHIRENLVGPEGNTWELVSWQSITGAVLTGGAGTAALIVGAHAFAAGAGSSIILLLPILVGVLMTVLVALLIMAARQAIITILLVVSPLAFVAFLLPNTEKYFEKWRSIGMTMLLMFPIFSVIFGGSQMAGALIIQNADSINLVILGLAVQVAPLIMTPLLIRFSGSLLGRIAGIVNNPNKGVIDRTRRWAEQRAGQAKSQRIAKGQGFLSNRARNIDARRRTREGWQKANDAMTEAKWGSGSNASDIQQYAMQAADVKEIGDSAAQARYHASKATSAEMQDLDIKARAAKLNVDLSKAKIDANWEEFVAGHGKNIISPEGLAGNALKKYQESRVNPIQQAMFESRAEARRAQSAQSAQTKNYAHALDNPLDKTLLKTAAGMDEHGETKVLAAAYGEILEGGTKNVNAGMELLKHQAIRKGQSQKNFASDIVKQVLAGEKEAKGYTDLTVEAAYEIMAQDGQIVPLEESRINKHVDQKMLSRVIARNVPTMKSKGGFHLQEDPDLAINIKDGETEEKATVRMNIARAASLGDTSAANIKDLKQGWIKEVKQNLGTIISDVNNIQDSDSRKDARATLEKAHANIYEALTNANIAPSITDIRAELLEIEEKLRGRPNPESPLPPPPPKSFSSTPQHNSRPSSQ